MTIVTIEASPAAPYTSVGVCVQNADDSKTEFLLAPGAREVFVVTGTERILIVESAVVVVPASPPPNALAVTSSLVETADAVRLPRVEPVAPSHHPANRFVARHPDEVKGF